MATATKSTASVKADEARLVLDRYLKYKLDPDAPEAYRVDVVTALDHFDSSILDEWLDGD